MKNKIFQKKNSNIVVFAFFVLFALSMTSCSKDRFDGDPYFYIEDQPTGITVDASGIKSANRKAYTIRSNRPWKITQETACDWLHILADEGEDDGIFSVWVDKNANFTDRSCNLIFTVNDQEQPMMLRVDQKADVPTVTIANAESGYEMLGKGAQIKIPVKNNVTWTASLSSTDWAAIDSIGKDTVYVSASKNLEDTPRTVTLTAVGTGTYSSLSSSTVITQATMGIIMSEHFDWMKEDAEIGFNYSKGGELSYGSWTADYLSHDWYTTVDKSGSTTPSLYGGNGYLKISRTNFTGNLISPAFSLIEGTQDVKVSFKSIGYISSKAKKDDGVLRVIVYQGGGTIEDTDTQVNLSNDGTSGPSYKARTFTVTVYPDSPKQEHGADYNPWNEAACNFSFVIRGANALTRIMFIGGNSWGDGFVGINRLYFDDIKAVAVE